MEIQKQTSCYVSFGIGLKSDSLVRLCKYPTTASATIDAKAVSRMARMLNLSMYSWKLFFLFIVTRSTSTVGVFDRTNFVGLLPDGLLLLTIDDCTSSTRLPT